MSHETGSVKAVVFDLGGVLIDWDPRLIFQQHFATRGVLEAFLAEVFWRAHHACHDTLAPFEETLAPYKRDYPHFAPALDAMATDWQKAVMGPIPETVAVLEELVARDVPVFALSNWPAQTWPPAHPNADDYAFLDHFRSIVVSGQVQLRKPDPAIYKLALEQFGLAAGEALFVDDLAGNADAATQAGMIGHQFLSADHLRTRLVSAGLL
ncbi:Hydrolase, haloacid dehalogenase-like family [Candidatus Phaeomarinobacter ectocarpi]|uniref:Hydrolase, haloacid dehalogenase-like family n=1 Tax=Candidatus Phaeomarinibacter ectocarpi TaxID=1458461 RepID=X5M781_9HYPH|nr:Hydrolase, haloacid dehalogenase-like family [Candidatus Phaeomarinobacter ectocarpi]